MDNPHTGYEAYCCGHSSGANLSGVDGNPRIAVFPAGFTTEAAALGGRVRTTSTGFTTVEPVIETLAALRCLPPLNEQPPIKRILEQIAATPAGQIPLLQANAPYSALAPLLPPPFAVCQKPKDQSPKYAKLQAKHAC